VTQPDAEILPSAYGTSFLLAWGAGYVDAVGFLTLAGLFVAHMSGNTVRLGVFAGGGDWSLAAQRVVPIVFFTLGVIGGIALVEALRRRSTPAPAGVLSIETALLLLFMVVGRAVLGGESATGARGSTTCSRSWSSWPWRCRTSPSDGLRVFRSTRPS
jgi:uncharacterized membrane protein YoaK (UPF0700 family)